MVMLTRLRSSNSSSSESSSPKKVQMFGGTSLLDDYPVKKALQIIAEEGNPKEEHPQKVPSIYHFKNKSKDDITEDVLKKVEKHLEVLLKKENLSKAAKRKLRILNKIKNTANGVVTVPILREKDRKNRNQKRIARKRRLQERLKELRNNKA